MVFGWFLEKKFKVRDNEEESSEDEWGVVVNHGKFFVEGASKRRDDKGGKETGKNEGIFDL